MGTPDQGNGRLARPRSTDLPEDAVKIAESLEMHSYSSEPVEFFRNVIKLENNYWYTISKTYERENQKLATVRQECSRSYLEQINRERADLASLQSALETRVASNIQIHAQLGDEILTDIDQIYEERHKLLLDQILDELELGF
jgi:hypothetical protein